MKHVFCMVWTVDIEACVVYGVVLWTMKHVFCMDVECTVDNEACVVYGVDCRQ